MLKIMLNFLVVVIVIAIPISANKPDFKILCANASDVDLERNEHLYQEYEKCVNDEVDFNQLNKDIQIVIQTLSSALASNSQVTNNENSMVFTTIKKYCPNANNIWKCEDILSPMLNCFTDEHRKLVTLHQRIKKSSLDFFCHEDAKEAEAFMKEKFLHCMHAYNDELNICLSQFVAFPKSIGRDDKVTYATEKEFCKSLETFGKCFIPKMEQCELSQTIGTHLKSFNTYIQTNVCTSYTNPTS